MGLILGRSQHLYIGYPLFFFYLIALIGVVLLIARPYWAFLFAVFCLAARDFHAAIFTRTPFFGPYLNLNDLLLWIALFAMLRECLGIRKQIWTPKILLAIFALILIGDSQSFYKYGFIEKVLRRTWSTAIFPIFFLVGANIIKTNRRAYSLYLALFLGAVLAALQHIFFVYNLTYSLLSPAMHAYRTISYSGSGGSFLLIGALLAMPSREFRGLKAVLYYIGLCLIGLSLVLSSTRGTWIITVIAIPALFLIIGRRQTIYRLMLRFAVLVVAGILIVQVLFPNLGLGRSLSERLATLEIGESFSESYEIRYEGLKTELDIWSKGSLILGTGSSLPLEFERAEIELTGALYHVGFTTYLAHFGLLGIIICVVLLPVSTLRIGRRYYVKHLMDPGGRLVLVAMACVLTGIIGLFSGGYLLDVGAHIPGLLYGAVWGLYRGRGLKRK